MGVGDYSGSFESDKELISEFLKIFSDIEFIGFRFSKEIWGGKRPDITSREIELLKEDKELTQQSSILKKLWTHLVSDAIVYLKSKDKREGDFHDSFAFGVDKLTSFFDTIGSFEQYMTSILTRSRDHTAHVMRVYMLGAIVLKEMKIDFVDCGELLENDKEITAKNGLGISPGEKEAMWCIMALCHDLGLVIENIFSVNREARKMIQQLGRISIKDFEFGLSPMFQHMCYNTLRLISSDLHEERSKQSDSEVTKEEEKEKKKYFVHTQYKYYTKFLNALDSYDHGILSCIILIKNLVYFLETDFLLDNIKPFNERDARQFLVRRTILQSIASHNCESIYHLAVMRFPFLLILFDEMQEWDRPRPIMLSQEDTLKSALAIDKMNNQMVDFKMTFSGGDKRTCHRYVYDYAKHKFTRFAKLLRSAVIGKGTQFKLHFEICDLTDGKNWSYKLEHDSPSPKDIVIRFPVDDEKWRKWVIEEFPKDFGKKEIENKEIDWFNWLIKNY